MRTAAHSCLMTRKSLGCARTTAATTELLSMSAVDDASDGASDAGALLPRCEDELRHSRLHFCPLRHSAGSLPLCYRPESHRRPDPLARRPHPRRNAKTPKFLLPLSLLRRACTAPTTTRRNEQMGKWGEVVGDVRLGAVPWPLCLVRASVTSPGGAVRARFKF